MFMQVVNSINVEGELSFQVLPVDCVTAKFVKSKFCSHIIYALRNEVCAVKCQ